MPGHASHDDAEWRAAQGAAAVTNLILKRASASRLSGEWNDDDYDVLLAMFCCDASIRSVLEA
jgi:hypothetical protein